MKSTRVLAPLCAVLLIVLSACSSDETGPGSDNVRLTAKMSSAMVSQGVLKNDNSAQHGHIDSLRIHRFRLLVSRIKLKAHSSDSAEHELHLAPLVLMVDSSNREHLVAQAEIPEGTYQHIKFEFHRFSSNEAAQYRDHAVFADFASNERYTLIVEGTYYLAGIATEFSLKMALTANLSLKLNEAFVVRDEATTELRLEIDPADIFLNGSVILDPTDSRDAKHIEQSLKLAIRVLKK